MDGIDLAGLARWLPDWAITLLVFSTLGLAAYLLHAVVFRLLVRLTQKWDLFWRSLLTRTRGPTRMAFVLVALIWAAELSPLRAPEAFVVSRIFQVLLILLAAWIIQTGLHIWTTIYLRRFKLDAEDNLLARKHATQSRILLRVGDIVIYVVAISAALMLFENVRQFGVSLLASAGVAGIVLGLALQPVLKNLLAGIQLAITQPIRIDDALLVEGEWGKVEEITATYVVVRVWDQRRLILPLAYFIEQPFQNWTREEAALLGAVMIHLDYRAPLDAIREKVAEVARNSPLWDGRVVATQVTEFHEATMEVRILVSAANSGNAFDLRCLMRERIVGYLQREHPEALPATRVLGTLELAGGGASAPV